MAHLMTLDSLVILGAVIVLTLPLALDTPQYIGQRTSVDNCRTLSNSRLGPTKNTLAKMNPLAPRTSWIG